MSIDRAEWDRRVAETDAANAKVSALAASKEDFALVLAAEECADEISSELDACARRICSEPATSIEDIHLLADMCQRVACVDTTLDDIFAEALGALLKGIRGVLPRAPS
jgi:hypothetical protein